MTSWPGLHTWSVRDEALHADLNTYVRDALDNLYDAPRCIVKRTATQSIPQNVYTAIAWTSEVEDDFGFHAVNAENLVVPAGLAGIYCVFFSVQMALSANGTFADVVLEVNNGAYVIGFDEVIWPATAAGDTNFCTLWPLGVGDSVRVTVLHDATAARNVTVPSDFAPYFGMCLVAP